MEKWDTFPLPQGTKYSIITERRYSFDNYHYISNVMRRGGKIHSIGGELTGSYAKEIALIGDYSFLRWI